MTFFPQKRDLLTVEVNQFWIVEEKPVERNTCTQHKQTKKGWSYTVQEEKSFIVNEEMKNCLEKSYTKTDRSRNRKYIGIIVKQEYK
jgi:hypothetical protein